MFSLFLFSLGTLDFQIFIGIRVSNMTVILNTILPLDHWYENLDKFQVLNIF